MSNHCVAPDPDLDFFLEEFRHDLTPQEKYGPRLESRGFDDITSEPPVHRSRPVTPNQRLHQRF